MTSCFDNGPIWVHARVDTGAREGRYRHTRGPITWFESRVISARVTKQIDAIFIKTCEKNI